jgi:hypothetical protein
MNGTTAALLAVGLYNVGAGVFKAAGARMQPLRGDRPLHLVGQVSGSPLWAAAVPMFGAGLGLQLIAFTDLPLGLTQPLFSAPLLLLLAIAFACFREMLAPREWLGVVLFGAGTLLVAVSVRGGEQSAGTLPPAALLYAVTVPSVLLPIVLFSAGDRRPSARHARPLAGVEYGASCGLLVGVMEVAAKGMTLVDISRSPGPVALLATPYPYLVGLAMTLAMGQSLIAMQRCRMVVTISVCTIVAKTYLLAVGTLLYGGDWPADPLWALPRLAGIALGVVALAVFPRYESGPPEAPGPPGSLAGGGSPEPPDPGPGGRSSRATTSSAVSISGRLPPR